MEPRLHKKWESLENQRKRLIEKLKPLSEAQLSHSPAPGSWSINEVLNHVIQSESGTLGYMRKKSQAEELPATGLSAAVKSFLLTLGLRSPLKFKVPAKVPPLPPAPDFKTLTQQWDEVREDIFQFLEALPASRTRVVIFRHAMIGYINIYQTLNFFRDHLAHHIKQIRRIQKSPNFPQS